MPPQHSRLFRRSTGLFVLVTLLPLLALLTVVYHQLDLSRTTRTAAMGAAVASWAICLVGAIIVHTLIARKANYFISILRHPGKAQAGLARVPDADGEFREIADLLRQYLRQPATPAALANTVADDLTTVMDSLQDGVIAVDCDEHILFANASAKRMLGTPSVQLSGRPMYEVIRYSSVQEMIRTAISSEQPDSVEIQIPRSETRVSMRAAPLVGGPRPGVVVVMHDVSDARKRETIRRDFIAAVSHELKTPLTVVQACTETLLDGALDEKEDAIHFLKQITEQSERMHQLITGMLQLARVESGQKVFHPVEIDLADLASRVCEEFRLPASQEEVRLTCEVTQTVAVFADVDAMRTIISNLVDNALKYCGPGESVTVACSRNENKAVLRVSDTGPGIAAEHRDRIFERFYRVDRHRSREKGGTGLGLAIVKHMVHLSGGMITLSSRVGHGSTFAVSMPLFVKDPSNAVSAELLARP